MLENLVHSIYRIVVLSYDMTNISDQMGKIIWKEGQVHVLINLIQSAYTTFVALSTEVTEATVRETFEKAKVQAEKLCVLPLEQFVANSAQNIEIGVVKNEYPEEDIVSGVLALLEKAPGMPIGVTWNGGIAYTASDYAYADKTYHDYLLKPEGTYRAAERSADPVHPLNHFGPLLGWKG